MVSSTRQLLNTCVTALKATIRTIRVHKKVAICLPLIVLGALLLFCHGSKKDTNIFNNVLRQAEGPGIFDNVYEQMEGYPCEAPYSDSVKVHVVIPIRDRSEYPRLNHLSMLGLTNADVFVYLRYVPVYFSVYNYWIASGKKLINYFRESSRVATGANLLQPSQLRCTFCLHTCVLLVRRQAFYSFLCHLIGPLRR